MTDTVPPLAHEKIATGRLDPGRYRLEVNNFAGPPGNKAAIKLTFFDSDGQRGS